MEYSPATHPFHARFRTKEQYDFYMEIANISAGFSEGQVNSLFKSLAERDLPVNEVKKFSLHKYGGDQMNSISYYLWLSGQHRKVPRVLSIMLNNKFDFHQMAQIGYADGHNISVEMIQIIAKPEYDLNLMIHLIQLARRYKCVENFKARVVLEILKR